MDLRVQLLPADALASAASADLQAAVAQALVGLTLPVSGAPIKVAVSVAQFEPPQWRHALSSLTAACLDYQAAKDQVGADVDAAWAGLRDVLHRVQLLLAESAAGLAPKLAGGA